jgi:Amt family ammonium transporter
MFKQIKGRYVAMMAGLFGMLPSLALADELSSGDTAWMMTATVLVLFMTIPGLSLFYAGMVRSKNVLSVLMQCFAITALMTVLWVIYGYNLAFGDGGSMNAFWGGFGTLFLAGMGGRFDDRYYSGNRVHDLPDDLCHYYAGTDRGRFC